jgi:hypothetical protein
MVLGSSDDRTPEEVFLSLRIAIQHVGDRNGFPDRKSVV